MLPSRAWRAYPQRYRMEAGRCTKCGKTFFPPRLVCSKCHGRDFETFDMKLTGKVLTYTIIRTPGDEYYGEAPFAVGILQMEDGPRLTTQIVDVPFEQIKIGLPLRLQFRRIVSDGEAGTISYGHKAVPVG